MKKYLLLFLAIALTIVSAGCGSNTTGETTTASPAQGETQNTTAAQNNEPAGITVSPPEGWVKNEKSVVIAQYMKNTASFILKEEIFAKKDLDSVTKQAKDSLASVFEDIEFAGEPESIKVDGRDAVRFMFSVPSIKFKYEYVYIIAGNTVYNAVFGDLAATFDNYTSDYQAILDSIKIK